MKEAWVFWGERLHIFCQICGSDPFFFFLALKNITRCFSAAVPEGTLVPWWQMIPVKGWSLASRAGSSHLRQLWVESSEIKLSKCWKVVFGLGFCQPYCSTRFQVEFCALTYGCSFSWATIRFFFLLQNLDKSHNWFLLCPPTYRLFSVGLLSAGVPWF